jgi:hypothetical protein
VIGKDEKKVAIISKNIFDEDQIYIYHFEEKHIWVNVCDSLPIRIDASWREYFKPI